LLLSTSNAGTTVPAGHIYGYKQGTSFSAPLAVGVASLMLAINPNLTPDALIARMKSSALPHASPVGYSSCAVSDTVACQCTTAQCGAGLLNPLGAVQDAAKPAAVIAAVGNPALGVSITLDGRASAAVGTPTIASFGWSQVSGLPVSIPNAGASVTQVVLPSTYGDLVFKLRVTDTAGQIGETQWIVRLQAPAAVAPSASGSGGGGGGADHGLWLALLALAGYSFYRRFSKKINP
jgi:serine protease